MNSDTLLISKNDVIIGELVLLGFDLVFESSFNDKINIVRAISLMTPVYENLFKWNSTDLKTHMYEKLLAHSFIRIIPNANTKFFRNFEVVCSNYVSNIIPLRRIALYVLILLIRIKKIALMKKITISSGNIHKYTVNNDQTILLEANEKDFIYH